MKVQVIRSYSGLKEYTVELSQGNQSFRMDYRGPLLDCRWYAKMFRIALKNHDAAKAGER